MTCQGTFQGIFQNVDNIGILGGTFTNVYHEKPDHASNTTVRTYFINSYKELDKKGIEQGGLSGPSRGTRSCRADFKSK